MEWLRCATAGWLCAFRQACLETGTSAGLLVSANRTAVPALSLTSKWQGFDPLLMLPHWQVILLVLQEVIIKVVTL
jgi:hypothetical protein